MEQSTSPAFEECLAPDGGADAGTCKQITGSVEVSAIHRMEPAAEIPWNRKFNKIGADRRSKQLFIYVFAGYNQGNIEQKSRRGSAACRMNLAAKCLVTGPTGACAHGTPELSLCSFGLPVASATYS